MSTERRQEERRVLMWAQQPRGQRQVQCLCLLAAAGHAASQPLAVLEASQPLAVLETPQLQLQVQVQVQQTQTQWLGQRRAS